MQKRKTFAAIFFLFLFCSVFGNNISISFEPETGLLYGRLKEKVWYAGMSFTDKSITFTPSSLMSQLDWDIKNSPYIGATLNISADKLRLSLRAVNALKHTCGTMEDYDWKSSGLLTNYSMSINNLTNFTQIEFLTGYIFRLNALNAVRLIPLAGIKIQNFNFNATGGYKRYLSENWEKIYFGNVKVISYNQSFAAPCIAFSTELEYTSWLEQHFSLDFTWIHTIDAFDQHHLKDKYYNDRLQKSILLDFQTKLLFKIYRNNKIGIKAGLSFMPDTYGFTFMFDKDSGEVSDNPVSGELGGSSRFLWSCAFVYSIGI